MANRKYSVWSVIGEEEPTWLMFYRFAESYKKALRVLLTEESNSNYNYNDEDIFPPYFLFSQYLELILKCLLFKKEKSEEIPKGQKGHDHSIILKKVKENYSDFKLTEDTEVFIESLEWINKFGQSCRYPTDTKGNKFWVHKVKFPKQFELSEIWMRINMTIEEIDEYMKDKEIIFKHLHTKTT